MGILNIDEHVEEHRLMAIRYPNKAVIPGTNVIAVSNIPFLIMPGDGSANGCQFTGTNGAFTLSAAILANAGVSLAGCYAYFSANFGGSSLPAGWYWTEFSSDTAGIVYAETYTSGKVSRPATKTAITPNLSGWVTGSTSEITGPSGFVLTGTALGKNGKLAAFLRLLGSTTGSKTYRVKIDSTNAVTTGASSAPVVDVLAHVYCLDSVTAKNAGKAAGSLVGVGSTSASANAAAQFSVDTSVDTAISFSLQGSSNLSGTVLAAAELLASYGE